MPQERPPSDDAESVHILTDPGEESSFWLATEDSEWDDNDSARMADEV